VTVKDEMLKRLQSSGAPEDQIAAQVQQIEQMAADPFSAQQLEQVVRMENVPAEMHMDITIEEVPDVASVQEEQFAQLTSLAPAVVFPPAVYIKASSLRNKKELLEMIEGQNAPPPDPVAVEMQKLQFEQGMEKTQAEIEKLRADALKARVDADVADAQLGVITDPRIVRAGGDEPMAQSVPAAGDTGVMMPPPGLSGV
jgi:hypothetical protein